MRPSLRNTGSEKSRVSSASRREIIGLAALGMLAANQASAKSAPTGHITIAAHISLAPTWFDPAETPGIITPFMLLYAMHDAAAKAMPLGPIAPCLAESWSASPDGLTYTFLVRPNAKFHNGERVTAEDIKFSFERYRGTSYQSLKDRVDAVEAPDARTVHFQLKAPWPDFLTFYAGATGASWVVPKKYLSRRTTALTAGQLCSV